MRNDYVIDTLTIVHVQETVKIGGKVIETYEGVFYRKMFKISPFGKVVEKINDFKKIKMNIMI